METVIVWVINPVVYDFTIRSYLKGIDWFNADRADLCEDCWHLKRVQEWMRVIAEDNLLAVNLE